MVVAHSADCVEQHLHDILSCITIAIKAAVEVTGSDTDEIASSDFDEIAGKRLLMLANKYNWSMLEPMLFQHDYDKLYLTSQELTVRTLRGRTQRGRRTGGCRRSCSMR